MYFEGSEKKLEISLKQGAKSLKSLPKTFWESLVKLSGAQILSSVSSPLCDSYLLSESSLFVFPHKFLMITNGKTRLVAAVREFLTQFKVDDIDSLFYERKNENFPSLQQSHFYQDAEELGRLVPGQAFRLGTEQGSHLYVFHMDRASSHLRNSESTLEVLMHDIDTETKKNFTKGKISARKWIAENPGFKSFFDSFDIQDHGFEPYGYSLNAIKGDRYFTFHVSPEHIGSYASFETNCFEQNVDELTLAVKSLFMPKNYQVVLFSGQALAFTGYADTKGNLKLEKTLSSGHSLQYFNIHETPTPELLKKIEVPAYIEPKVNEVKVVEVRVEEKIVLKEVIVKDENGWFFERNDNFAIGVKVNQTFFSEESEIQKVEIHDTSAWGKTLVANGQVMCAEKDEFIYHEMITHVPMFVHPDPTRVLIIGGGDLGAAREVLKHASVFECVCVENDQNVVEAAKAHFEWPTQVFDDSRFELIIADGATFVAQTERQFDVIIVDSAGPSGVGAVYYTEEFYNNVKKVLAAGGVVVSQAESPLYFAEEQKALKATLTKVFGKAFLYNYSNGSYPGGLGSFAFSSESFHPLDEFDREKAMKVQMDFKYYSPELHYAAFILPTFMKKNLKDIPKSAEVEEQPQAHEALHTESP